MSSFPLALGLLGPGSRSFRPLPDSFEESVWDGALVALLFEANEWGSPPNYVSVLPDRLPNVPSATQAELLAWAWSRHMPR